MLAEGTNMKYTPNEVRYGFGFENILRKVLKFNERIGQKHGEQKKDGSYDPAHQGVQKPK